MTQLEYDLYLSKNNSLKWARVLNSESTERETGKGGLHEMIVHWCNSQWPRVKFISARTDQRSTIAVGAHDFTLYLPKGRVLNVECKARGGKLSIEQQAWIRELQMLGHEVQVVWSFDEFLKLV